MTEIVQQIPEKLTRPNIESTAANLIKEYIKVLGELPEFTAAIAKKYFNKIGDGHDDGYVRFRRGDYSYDVLYGRDNLYAHSLRIARTRGAVRDIQDRPDEVVDIADIYADPDKSTLSRIEHFDYIEPDDKKKLAVNNRTAVEKAKEILEGLKS